MNARNFIDLAVKMQRRAMIADKRGEARMVLSYCRRRNYAADRAKRLGAKAWDVWSAIDDAVKELEDGFLQREARS